jgi:hypothetical protein
MSTDRQDDDFPVARKPPVSHYWPKRDQAKRKRDLKVRSRGRAIIKAAPFLADPKFRPMLLSLCRLTILIERSYESLADDESLISGETGELRTSLTTLNGLIAQQTRLLTALGLAPSVIGKITRERPIDLAAAFAHVESTDDGEDPDTE